MSAHVVLWPDRSPVDRLAPWEIPRGLSCAEIKAFICLHQARMVNLTRSSGPVPWRVEEAPGVGRRHLVVKRDWLVWD